MLRFGLSAVCGLVLACSLTGCGSSAPPRAEAEIQETAGQHEAMAKEMADMYKKGGPKKSHGN
jgi:hypothetical protein